MLFLLLNRTRLGRAIRATVQNPTSARLLGVERRRVSASASASAWPRPRLPGRCTGCVYPFNPGSHYDLISRLLTIIVLGGLGSLGGAVVAALLMGVDRVASSRPTISPTWSWLTFFIVLIASCSSGRRGCSASASEVRCEPADRGGVVRAAWCSAR